MDPTLVQIATLLAHTGLAGVMTGLAWRAAADRRAARELERAAAAAEADARRILELATERLRARRAGLEAGPAPGAPTSIDRGAAPDARIVQFPNPAGRARAGSEACAPGDAG
jgi:hypothetical protein